MEEKPPWCNEAPTEFETPSDLLLALWIYNVSGRLKVPPQLRQAKTPTDLGQYDDKGWHSHRYRSLLSEHYSGSRQTIELTALRGGR
jgi:hypothetical protein